MKRAVTLVELLIACAIAAVGVAFTLILSANVLQAGARVRARNADHAAAQVALYRLKNELSRASGSQMSSGTLALTTSDGGLRWQVVTLQGRPTLTRTPSGQTPTLAHAVASDISQLQLSSGPNAQTLAITSGAVGRRVKLTETLRAWGTTL